MIKFKVGDIVITNKNSKYFAELKIKAKIVKMEYNYHSSERDVCYIEWIDEKTIEEYNGRYKPLFKITDIPHYTFRFDLFKKPDHNLKCRKNVRI